MTEKIRAIVEDVLNDDPKSRDSDNWLIIQVLRRLGVRFQINDEDIKDMPSLETITRIRRSV